MEHKHQQYDTCLFRIKIIMVLSLTHQTDKTNIILKSFKGLTECNFANKTMAINNIAAKVVSSDKNKYFETILVYFCKT